MTARLALALDLAGLAILFGWRSWRQHRRTGSTGFRGPSGRAGSREWWGGVLFAVAVLLGVLAPVLATTGVLTATPHPAVAGIGLAVTLTGFSLALAAQQNMGDAWRIGVDPDERTELVTAGVFGRVRNPVFSALVLGQVGMVLLVPTWLNALSLLALLVAVQIQVRAVEEPYLVALHGEAYQTYCRQSGRFLPRLSSNG
jgi:protein-S-isoprenylcysteine O-methyltransferase Ste14